MKSIAQNISYEEWYLLTQDGLDIFIKELFLDDKKDVDDTVIVVHGGFGANHDYMLDAVESLCDKFHFVLYDQRGSLLSHCDKKRLTFKKNVEDLYALVVALGGKKVKLFCHSMGTLVGMEFIKQHPDLVSNVVMVGAILPKSNSSKSVFSKRLEKQVAYLQNRKEVVSILKPYNDKGYESINTFEAFEKSGLSHKEITEAWRINFATVNIYDVSKFKILKGGKGYYMPEAAIMSETVNWRYDYRDALNSTQKTTIIQGEYDFLDFKAEKYKASIKDYNNINLTVIENAGHNIWIDKPKKFKSALLKALK